MDDRLRTYRLQEVLGIGSFGVVYRAEARGVAGFVKPVAVKMLHPHLEGDESVLGRLRDEARVLGRLHHRAVVHTEGLTRLDGRWALVMEYVPGADLAEVLKRHGPLPLGPALEMVEEVAAALHAAEPVGLLHRDLKPANLRLTPSGEVRVLDFGIARASLESRESRTGPVPVGTHAYMAPERMRHQDTAAGDIYALGAVVVEALTGTALGPAGADPADHAARVGQVVDAMMGRGVPSDVAASIGTWIHWDPATRPAAREVRDAARASGRSHGTTSLAQFAQVVVTAIPAQQGRDARWGLTLRETTEATPTETSVDATVADPVEPVSSTGFVGRRTVLSAVHDALQEGHDVAVRGMGGVGKTMLAREYARRFEPFYPGGVHFLSGRQPLGAQLVSWLLARGYPVPPRAAGADIETHERGLREAVAGAGGSKPALWVVDDVEAAGLAETWQCPWPTGRTLVTTRGRVDWAHDVELRELERPASRHLLWRGHAPRDDLAARQGEELLDTLGDHALAVAVAGSLVPHLGIAGVHERLQAPGALLDDLAEQLAGALPTGHTRAIGATFAAGAERQEPATRDLLRAMARLAPNTPIPRSLVDAVLEGLDVTDPGARIRAIEQAVGGSMLRMESPIEEGQPASLAIHPVVARTVLATETAPERAEHVADLLEAELVHALVVGRGERPDAAQLALAPHAEVLGLRRDEGRGPLRLGASMVLCKAERFGEAEVIAKDVLRVRASKLGEAHPATLEVFPVLNSILERRGRIQETLGLARRFVAASRACHGDNHATTRAARFRLGASQQIAGELAESRRTLTELIEELRGSLGPSHLHTRRAENSLSLLLSKMGEPEAAVALARGVVETYRAELGERDFRTLLARSNLFVVDPAADPAGILSLLDDIGETMGPDTLLTLSTRARLVAALLGDGRSDEARAHSDHLLRVSRDLMGPEHPDTLAFHGSRAQLDLQTGRLHEALDRARWLLELRTERLGAEHVSTLWSVGILAEVYEALGEVTEARELLQEHLPVIQRVLGPDHEVTRVASEIFERVGP